MTEAGAADGFDVVEVLTRADAARDAFCARMAQLGEARERTLDAQLVSDVLRADGRVGDTLETRRALVELCALLRAIDATERGRIELAELRRGLELHAGRTGRFAEFHDARVLLRTLGELLDHPSVADGGDAPGVRAQLALLHRELRAWAIEQLTGSADGHVGHARSGERAAPASAELLDPRAPWRVRDRAARVANDGLVHELLQGAQGHPVTGLLGAAWIRGWSAVPIAGEQLGEVAGSLDRLAAALEHLDPRPMTLVQVDRLRSPRWTLEGARIRVGDHLRDSWALPATGAGLELAAGERRGWSILTTDQLAFAVVEGAGHHALLGPRGFVEVALGVGVLDAMAEFREHVESLAVDGEPPEDLLEVATSFGRYRRRSR
ncbi:MAG: hypothetical protein JWM86_2437 [Thermoleophilia bacterium]|nr:hypothetical protein [Thermoleophilia bacterium]